MAILDTDKILVHRNETSYWMSALDFKNSFDFGHHHSPNYLLKGSYLTRGTGTYLTLNRSTTPTNTRKGTLSYWVKPTKVVTGRDYHVATGLGSTSNSYMQVYIINESFKVGQYSHTPFINNSRKIRDLAGWYHVVLSWDGDASGTNNIMRFYVNGELQTNTGTAPNVDFALTKPNQNLYIGQESASYSSESYYSEIHIIDGQALTCDSFGYREEHGYWYPKEYVGEYGNNGFYLDFDGDFNDKSGNNHHFTPTGNVATDLSKDCPTDIYATLNPLAGTKNTISDGNLKYSGSTGGDYHRPSTLAASSGKWYFEVKATAIPADFYIGISEISNNSNYDSVSVGNASNGSQYAIYSSSGGSVCSKVNNGFTATSLSKAVNGDIIQIAFDLDNNKFWFGINNTWADSGNPSTGANSLFTVTAGTYALALTLSGAGVSTTLEANFGQRPFTYTPPDGFKALSTRNLPPVDLAVQEGFKTVTYAGNGGTSQSIDSVGFKPDFVWLKGINVQNGHGLYDSVRGAGKRLLSHLTNAEDNITGVSSFDSNGFTLSTTYNTSGETYVAWCWKAGESAVINNDGTIESTVNANPDTGFSVVTYTGTGNVSTVGHGLGTAPSFIIVKTINIIGAWKIYHSSLGATQAIEFTTGPSATNSVYWNNTAPTNFVFTAGTAGAINSSGINHVAYCFAEVEGFSKFGVYTGNGNADGPFVYTGFRPAFVLCKHYNDLGGSNQEWVMFDSARGTYNPTEGMLSPTFNYKDYGSSIKAIDFLSNGFKWRTNQLWANGSGSTYIFMAFAEAPSQYSNAR